MRNNWHVRELGESTGENTGDSTGENTGENTGDSTGENTGDSTGETVQSTWPIINYIHRYHERVQSIAR
ncbi:hypothetical protein BGAL_0184g00020 [Botrytis galanthina]|uniref:Uncharacterized protein n=1 Tax=Botrytis galanthina TaxID=278940 RepID=A0A4S8QYM2_9HELO|nr:hypothetical protein BGAL_0184g00020 [Botrytis galanthina]